MFWSFNTKLDQLAVNVSYKQCFWNSVSLTSRNISTYNFHPGGASKVVKCLSFLILKKSSPFTPRRTSLSDPILIWSRLKPVLRSPIECCVSQIYGEPARKKRCSFLKGTLSLRPLRFFCFDWRLTVPRVMCVALPLHFLSLERICVFMCVKFFWCVQAELTSNKRQISNAVLQCIFHFYMW